MSHSFPPGIENQSNLDGNSLFSINNLSPTANTLFNLSNSPYTFKCFFRSFCSDSFYSHCFNTTLATCDQCSYAGLVTYGVVLIFLGLTIVTMNSVVLWQITRKKNKGTYDKIRTSLAVADILSGVQTLVILLYNLHWTMNSTSNEFLQTVLQLIGSRQAVAGGTIHLLGFSSSLYHLVFLSLQRVFAMKWPLKYKLQKARTVNIGLGIVWVLAILTSAVPACFPDKFLFLYVDNNFYFTFVASIETSLTMISIAYGLPYCIMTSCVTYSAILIRRGSAQSRRLSGNNLYQEAHNKREASMLKTLAFMLVGFTITLLPHAIFVVVILLSIEPSCKASFFGQIFFCLTLCNSLVNPLVYSIRDKQFRQSIVQCFPSKKCFLGARD